MHKETRGKAAISTYVGQCCILFLAEKSTSFFDPGFHFTRRKYTRNGDTPGLKSVFTKGHENATRKKLFRKHMHVKVLYHKNCVGNNAPGEIHDSL